MDLERAKKILREWVIPFGLEIIAVILVIKFVFFFAVVPTGSMIPTVEEKTWLFATRMYLPERTVERGDILVFQSDELDQILLKRCVGLPGDHIVLDEEGKMYLNGEYYPEPYVVNTQPMAGEFQVPEGCFLFMGDNRNGSLDARYWEQPYIEGDKIQGKAQFTLWPLKNFGPLK